MLYLSRTIVLLVFLMVSSALCVLAQGAKKNTVCTNHLVMPNADLDNYELPLTGKLKRVETQEIDLVDNLNADLIATTDFDELGRVSNTFLSNSKIKVFGKEIYRYDAQNRLVLINSYNPDGAAVMEDVFTYDSTGSLKQKVSRNAKTKVVIWNKEFSYPAGNEYSELFDKRHGFGFRYKKDNRCRIVEVTSFDLGRTVTSKFLVSYDDEKNTMEESIYSPDGNLLDKKKAEFELDANGNWVKKTRYDLAIENGKPVFKPTIIVHRKITYYDSK